MNFITQYWIQFLFGVLISFVGYLYKKIVDYKKLMTATKNGVQALLKVKIIERYNEYSKLENVTIYDKETIDQLYREYKNLGGNGVIEKLIKEIEDIPLNKKNIGGE